MKNHLRASFVKNNTDNVETLDIPISLFLTEDARAEPVVDRENLDKLLDHWISMDLGGRKAHWPDPESLRGTLISIEPDGLIVQTIMAFRDDDDDLPFYPISQFEKLIDFELIELP